MANHQETTPSIDDEGNHKHATTKNKCKKEHNGWIGKQTPQQHTMEQSTQNPFASPWRPPWWSRGRVARTTGFFLYYYFILFFLDICLNGKGCGGCGVSFSFGKNQHKQTLAPKPSCKTSFPQRGRKRKLLSWREPISKEYPEPFSKETNQ
jgi:hypothetical protein